ncbi:MAG: FAD-dependent oxidoreductase, partial [Planctomycetota bacterium]
MKQAALVLGGGIAGIASAVRLAEHDVEVTLVETSRRLGGRAGSHEDPQSGRVVDNCQHVLMGCCTNLVDLYKRLGVIDSIRWHRRLHFFDKHGHHDVLACGILPAPMHLGPALWRFGCLSFGEKAAISRAMLVMMRVGPEARAALGDEDFASWLTRHGQPAGAMKKYWEVVVVSALNQRMEQTGASYALQVFQE